MFYGARAKRNGKAVDHANSIDADYNESPSSDLPYGLIIRCRLRT